MKLNIWIALMLAATLVTTGVFALPVTIDEVEVDGSEVFADEFNRLDIERGQEVEVRVEFTAEEDVDNVELLLFLSGYEYNDRDGETISDVIGPLNLRAGTTYVRTATLKFPLDLEVDEYKLRLVMADRSGDEIMERYNIQVDTPRHALMLSDVFFVPGQTVRAGEALIAKVRLENKGQNGEDDVRVTVEIPALGLKQQGFINEIEDGDEQQETEDLLLRVPVCTQAGTYDLDVTVDYNNQRDQEAGKYEVTVLASDLCNNDSTPKTTITLGNDFQTIAKGGSGIYSLAVMNNGNKATSYNLAISAPQGVSYKVSPSSAAVLGAGQSQTFYVFVEADKTVSGPQIVTVAVNAGSQMIQQVSLTANVESGGWTAKRVLEVGVIMLLVLLIVVGLVVGLSRLRGDRDEKTTYY